MRYIIDYYHDASRADADGLPALRDKDTVRSIRLDVRPAPDSVEVGARPGARGGGVTSSRVGGGR